MNAFKNALSRAARRVIDRAGEAIVLVKKSGHRLTGLTAHIQTDAEFTTDQTKGIDHRTEVEIMAEDVGSLSRGDEILTADEKVYRVEEILQDDGITISAVLIEVTG